LGSGTADATRVLFGDRVWRSTPGAPAAPVANPNGWYRADTLGLANNASVATWPDEGSANLDLTAAGSAQPTFKTDDAGDGRPYVSFDGTDDALFFDNASTEIYSLGPLTVYGVFRCAGNDNDGLGGLNFSTGFDHNFSGGFPLRADTGYFYITRNSVSYNAIAANVGATGYMPDFRQWHPFCLRWSMIEGRAVLTINYGSSQHAIDLAASLTIFQFSVIILGSRFNSGAPSNFSKCQWREFLWYGAGHSDDQVASNLAYLRGKWGCA
jgi:hypothetical protein